jgi:hypothetical protein
VAIKMGASQERRRIMKASSSCGLMSMASATWRGS